MRVRVKVWQDTGEIEINPTWLRAKSYAELPLCYDLEALVKFEAAWVAYEEAKRDIVEHLCSPEPLSDEERAVLTTDEVIA